MASNEYRIVEALTFLVRAQNTIQAHGVHGTEFDQTPLQTYIMRRAVCVRQ